VGLSRAGLPRGRGRHTSISHATDEAGVMTRVAAARANLSAAVVVPCYRVRQHILSVISAVPPLVSHIICVDYQCPEKTADLIESQCRDPRVRVVRNSANEGVGGATMRGYIEALRLGAQIIVKIDGDGQMNPRLVGSFVNPIAQGAADYTKGNRFYKPESLQGMPAARLLGNAILSLLCKLSTGYWNVVDPNNGYTAIHANVLRLLPLHKISRRFFFERDVLFRLNTVRAVVVDVPIDAVYRGETSNLSPARQVLPFLRGHVGNFAKRCFYSYLLRDFNLASVLTLLGVPMILGGVSFGAVKWVNSIRTGELATAGTVMVAALPILVGLQMLLAALSYDISNVPRQPIHGALDPDDPQQSALHLDESA
jgi:dolichol-phosphate mannosyltransferase